MMGFCDAGVQYKEFPLEMTEKKSRRLDWAGRDYSTDGNYVACSEEEFLRRMFRVGCTNS
jgi:hypothetical protein